MNTGTPGYADFVFGIIIVLCGLIAGLSCAGWIMEWPIP